MPDVNFQFYDNFAKFKQKRRSSSAGLSVFCFGITLTTRHCYGRVLGRFLARHLGCRCDAHIGGYGNGLCLEHKHTTGEFTAQRVEGLVSRGRTSWSNPLFRAIRQTPSTSSLPSRRTETNPEVTHGRSLIRRRVDLSGLARRFAFYSPAFQAA